MNCNNCGKSTTGGYIVEENSMGGGAFIICDSRCLLEWAQEKVDAERADEHPPTQVGSTT